MLRPENFSVSLQLARSPGDWGSHVDQRHDASIVEDALDLIHNFGSELVVFLFLCGEDDLGDREDGCHNVNLPRLGLGQQRINDRQSVDITVDI